MDDFDLIEIELDDEKSEVNMKENYKKPTYTTLEKEIKIEEESRKLHKDHIANFKKSEKPKKSLKNKIIAWALIGVTIAGLAFGGAMLYKNNFSEQAKYQKELQNHYQIANENLQYTLNRDCPYYRGIDRNKKIEYLTFSEETQDPTLTVYFEGDYYAESLNKYFAYDGSATYKVLEEYYNNLVSAEESGNALNYIDALNNVFETMEYQDSESHKKIEFTNLEKTEENVNKINALFALDVKDDNIIRQVGFLPYNIEVVKWETDEETKILNYTYKIRGISYCETKEPSTANISNDEDLVILNNYDKTHVKAYYRDIVISSSEPYKMGYQQTTRLCGDINKFIDSVKTSKDFQVETTRFEYSDLFENFYKMQEGNFNFEKPSEQTK